MKTMGYAALNATTPLVPFSFERRALRRNDVAIEILWSGVCHSDLHQTRDDWKEWGATVYPCVPGHEIIGRVRLAVKLAAIRLGRWWPSGR